MTIITPVITATIQAPSAEWSADARLAATQTASGGAAQGCVEALATSGGDTVPGPTMDPRLAQLLCSRLCHDLIGPAGGISAALEFLGGAGYGDAEAWSLLAGSAQALTSKLAFFRLAFGSGGSAGTTVSVIKVRDLGAGLLEGSRVSLEWSTQQRGCEPLAEALPLDVARIVLCLVLVGADALPRGGALKFEVTGGPAGWRIVCEAIGRGARLEGALLAAMRPEADQDFLNARNIHGHYLAILADRLGGKIVPSTAALDRVALRVPLPLVTAAGPRDV